MMMSLYTPWRHTGEVDLFSTHSYNLCDRRRQMISLTLWLLNLQGPLKGTPGEPQSQSGHLTEEKNLLPLPNCPAHTLVNMLTGYPSLTSNLLSPYSELLTHTFWKGYTCISITRCWDQPKLTFLLSRDSFLGRELLIKLLPNSELLLLLSLSSSTVSCGCSPIIVWYTRSPPDCTISMSRSASTTWNRHLTRKQNTLWPERWLEKTKAVGWTGLHQGFWIPHRILQVLQIKQAPLMNSI